MYLLLSSGYMCISIYNNPYKKEMKIVFLKWTFFFLQKPPTILLVIYSSFDLSQ